MTAITRLDASWWLTGALAVAFLAAGSFGHDPWKPDEAYSFGLVLSILDGGSWIVPTLAGEPFMEKPPLYYLVAAATGRVFEPIMPLHDAVRMASLVFVGLALAATALIARKLFGPGRAEKAMLLMIGCIGLAQYAHEAITDNALLAGFALAMLGLAWSLERPRLAGALLGTGVGIGFMSKGLVEPGIVAIAVLLLFFFRTWRRRAFLSSLAWSLPFALPWLLIWPVALYRTDPALFDTWLWINNFGRYLGFARLGADTEPWYYTRTLPWFTLPAGPLALWALARHWRDRDEAGAAGVQLAACLSAAILLVLTTSATARQLYALPLLVPLCVLGSTVVDRMPAPVGRATALAWALVAVGIAIVAWGVWAYAIAHAMAPSIPALLEWLPASFRFRVQPVLVGAAALIAGMWIVVWTSRRTRSSWVHLWAASTVLIWGTVMTLWLPWIDAARRFRETFSEMARHVPAGECLSSFSLGEPQRAMLHYYARIKTRRIESGSPPCEYHLVQTSTSGKPRSAPDPGWTLLWKGQRPGETEEKFALYGRDSDSRVAAMRRPAR